MFPETPARPDWLPLADGAAYPTVPADELRPHQAALRMPPLSEDEFTALVEDIEQRGVDYPVLVDEDGMILDGVNRWRACKRLDLPVPLRVKAGLTGTEKLTRALSWNLRRRHLTKDQKKEIAKGLQADGHSYARIEEITGWPHSTVHDWLRPRGEPALNDRRAIPGEHPPRGSERDLELIRQCLDPEVDEDTRAWAKGDGATAMFSIEDYRKAPDSRHAVDQAAARDRLIEFAADIGMTLEALIPYWVTATDWPFETRKPRTSYAAHAAVRGNNRALLRSGMDEHDAQMAAMDAVAKKLDEVVRLILDNQELPWASFEFVQREMGNITAYLEGGWDGFVAYVKANRPEPRCDACGWPESKGHHRMCSAPKPCEECEGTNGGHLADCPALERMRGLVQALAQLNDKRPPRDHQRQLGDKVAGEAPPPE